MQAQRLSRCSEQSRWSIHRCARCEDRLHRTGRKRRSPRSGPIAITLAVADSSAILAVTDTGPGFIFAPALPRDRLSAGGRGLFLVACHATEVSVERLNAAGTRFQRHYRSGFVGLSVNFKERIQLRNRKHFPNVWVNANEVDCAPISFRLLSL